MSPRTAAVRPPGHRPGRRPPGPLRAARPRLAGLLALLAALACTLGPTTAPLPPLHRVETTSRVPLVLVPGATGSELVDVQGRVHWGTAARLLLPRDRGRAIALPADPAERRLRAGGVLRRVSLLGVVHQPVYGPLLAAFEDAGYRPGSLADPRPGATLLPFPYDWRLGMEEVAAELAAALEGLRRARGGGTLEVDLVCQSSGGQVCRYLLKHGGAPLDEAAAGRGGPPPGIRVRNLVLVGAPVGGSLRNLQILDRGRRYLPAGRRFGPETLATFPFLFHDLPADAGDRFLDTDGRVLDVDLYDVESWRRYGWSVFSTRTARRLDALPAGEPLADPAERRRRMARQLERARRFQRLVAADVDPGDTRYLLVQSAYTRTPVKAVLERREGGWITRFPRDPWFRDHPYLRELASTPGDGHVPLSSADALSPGERAALAADPFTVEAGHFDTILAPAAQRRIVEHLDGR